MTSKTAVCTFKEKFFYFTLYMKSIDNRVTCECKSVVSKSYYKRHLLTKKHKEKLKRITVEESSILSDTEMQSDCEESILSE